MGRRDAVQVTVEVIARMRQLDPRLVVSYEPGWERRGNGTTANYEGGIVHHTASASSLALPFPTQGLLRDGRKDLSGPLCNEAVPACIVDRPRLHVVAAHPANHAGASGGRSMGPLPRTSLFNPRVRGLEIDYAGTVPMLAGQLHVAYLWSRANADVVGGGDIERIRAHFETSVTGKWDIGYANGKSYDMAAFRRDAANLQEDDMPLTDADVKKVVDALIDRDIFFPYRNPDEPDGVGESSVPLGTLLQGLYVQTFWGVVGGSSDWGPGVALQLQAIRKELDAIQATAGTPAPGARGSVQIDASGVAAALAKDQTFLAGLAKAVNDDAARRLAS